MGYFRSQDEAGLNFQYKGSELNPKERPKTFSCYK